MANVGPPTPQRLETRTRNQTKHSMKGLGRHFRQPRSVQRWVWRPAVGINTLEFLCVFCFAESVTRLHAETQSPPKSAKLYRFFCRKLSSPQPRAKPNNFTVTVWKAQGPVTGTRRVLPLQPFLILRVAPGLLPNRFLEAKPQQPLKHKNIVRFESHRLQPQVGISQSPFSSYTHSSRRNSPIHKVRISRLPSLSLSVFLRLLREDPPVLRRGLWVQEAHPSGQRTQRTENSTSGRASHCMDTD